MKKGNRIARTERYIRLLIVFAVLVLAFFLRTHNLDTVPPAPSLDEVSIGYNAYSIVKTGRDEYGTVFPLILRAYDDYRPAFYMYLVVPFVAFMGLSATAVRMPAVLLGIAAVAGSYALTREMLIAGHGASGGKREAGFLREAVPVITALLLAVSPWHVYMSRLGHEVNAGVTTVIFGVFLFLRYVRVGNPVTLIVSVMVIALSLYTYQSQKIVTPALCVTLLFFYGYALKKDVKTAALAGFFGIILVLPAILQLTDSSNLIRLKATNAYLNSPAYIMALTEYPEYRTSGTLADRIVHNPKTVAVKIMATNYFSHFAPEWVFAGGPKESHKVPYTGLLYPWTAPFLLLGIIFFMTEARRNVLVLAGVWLLVSFLPAAITTMAPHAMRTMTVMPIPEFLTAYGIARTFSYLANRFTKTAFVCALAILGFCGVRNMVAMYMNVFPAVHSGSFQYALSAALPDIIREAGDDRPVIVSNYDNLTQSYMFYLFHSRMDPVRYQQMGGTGSGGYAEVHTIGNFTFRPIDWDKDRDAAGTLIMGNTKEMVAPRTVASEYHNLDGSPAVTVVRVP
jgi:4-amino-4-deoxy-L-arabinose transferase-like glycosyltransferase